MLQQPLQILDLKRQSLLRKLPTALPSTGLLRVVAVPKYFCHEMSRCLTYQQVISKICILLKFFLVAGKHEMDTLVIRRWFPTEQRSMKVAFATCIVGVQLPMGHSYNSS